MGYLGGTYGVYGEASGTGTAISGKNSNTDSSSTTGYGVKGQSGGSIGILGTNRSCRQVSYDCNCDWDTSSQQIVCDTCNETVCDQPGVGVHGQATAPDFAGLFDGSVKVNGGLVIQGAASQTAKLQEWKNSSNVTVASVSPTGVFTGNGSGLTNVTASNLSINCTEGQVLKKVGGSWQCSAPCEVGDMVACYTGPSGTVNVGTCRAGWRTCGSTSWGPCVGEIFPAAETCTGIDANCNGILNDAARDAAGCTTYYRDADGDGDGDPGSKLCMCAAPAGYVSNKLDCNDSNPDVNRFSDWFATPIPGSNPANWDYNCDGTIDFRYEYSQSAVYNQCSEVYNSPTDTYDCFSYYPLWDGWTVPACGATGQLRTCEYDANQVCVWGPPRPVKQQCQ
jgi:hypothetical protein